MINTLKTATREVINSIDRTIDFNTKNKLNSSSVNIKDFTLSGSVYIYYEDDILTSEQVAQITAAYRESGQMVQLRSSEFKLKVWDQIKLGQFPKMRRYELNSVGRIVPVGTSS